jgi:tetratricopeptide (TPR) repeat protein
MTKLHWIAVVSAFILGVLLYLAPDKHTSGVVQEIDLENKVAQALEIMQTGQEPMAGIGLLLEVIEEDPEHEQALLYLGVFSFQSGQYTKSLERLEKLVGINPQAADAWFYLGLSHAALEQKADAIACFEKYQSMSDDQELNDMAGKYITDLKNS